MEVSTDLHAHILSVFQEEADKIFTASALKVPDNEASREMLARHKKLFMDSARANIGVSIDAAYFGEEVDAGALPEMQPSAVKTDQDALELETALPNLIDRRRKATKLCRDAFEKTLEVEKKALISLIVAPGVGTSTLEKFDLDDRALSDPMRCKELKTGAKKAADIVKESIMSVNKLSGRTEEITKAVLIHKELQENL